MPRPARTRFHGSGKTGTAVDEVQVVLTFLNMPLKSEAADMSNNYRFYAEKEIAKRATRRLEAHPLRDQLADLLDAVQRCERIWSIEERIEKSR